MVNRLFRISLPVLILYVFLLSTPTSARAVPPLPSSFYGVVKLNGANVPDGTLVQAVINEKVIAYSQTQTYQGDSVYALDIPGDDTSTTAVEGGAEGDTISFKIGGILAGQSGVWHMATNVRLDLSASSANTPLAPQPTATPLPTQTAIPVIPTQVPPTKAVPTSAPTAAPPAAPTKALTAAPADETQPPANTPQGGRTTATSQPASSGSSAITPSSPSAQATSVDTGTKVSSAESNSTGESPAQAPMTNPKAWIIIPAAILLVGLVALWYFKWKK
jgi:hypothetical protein